MYVCIIWKKRNIHYSLARIIHLQIDNVGLRGIIKNNYVQNVKNLKKIEPKTSPTSRPT